MIAMRESICNKGCQDINQKYEILRRFTIDYKQDVLLGNFFLIQLFGPSL